MIGCLVALSQILYTHPVTPRAGEEAMVFYNPDITVLRGRPEVYLRASWNRRERWIAWRMIRAHDAQGWVSAIHSIRSNSQQTARRRSTLLVSSQVVAPPWHSASEHGASAARRLWLSAGYCPGVPWFLLVTPGLVGAYMHWRCVLGTVELPDCSSSGEAPMLNVSITGQACMMGSGSAHPSKSQI